MPKADVGASRANKGEGITSITLSAWGRSLYRLLLTHAETAQEHHLDRLGLPPDELRRHLSELIELGLVVEGACGFRAIPYHQAIDTLLAEQSQLARATGNEILRLRQRLGSLVMEHDWLADDGAGTVVGVSQDVAGAENHLDERSARATNSLADLRPGARFSPHLIESWLKAARACISRGIRTRVVHQAATLSNPRAADYLHELQRIGVQVRVREELPFRLTVIDETTSVYCIEWKEGMAETIHSEGAPLAALLNRLFETIWIESAPLSIKRIEAGARSSSQSMELTPQHEAIIRHLAEGATDTAIAKALGVTTRTMSRRIGEIYDIIGVKSRFQAGVAAQRLGLV